MAGQFSRRSFLKGGAFAVGAFALGGFPRADSAIAAPQEKAKVFFTKDISLEGLMKVYARVNQGMIGRIAIKLHTGEPHGPNILPREMVKGFQANIPNSSIVECNVLYPSPRQTTEGHRETLRANGWTFCHVDIMEEDGDISLPIPGGKWLAEVSVGKHILNYDSMLVLAHFKGHPMGGYGGALKQLAIGCASRAGKALIHSAGKTDDRFKTWEQHASSVVFPEAMADAASSVIEHFRGKIAFINVMKNLSVDCDCCAVAEDPCMKDIGILASLDPVAIDQACIDLVMQSDDPGREHFMERVNSRNGIHTIEAAADLGFGSREYELIEI